MSGGIGIDCRYCHTSVEVSPSAGIPPTKTCINCHSQIWNHSPYLEPVRASFRDDKPLNWIRVHDLPDFVYFNHSIHVQQGRRLRNLSWPRRSHAADVPGEVAADGVVPGLPPRSVALRAAARSDHDDGLRAAAASVNGADLVTRLQDRGRGRTDQLLGLPPMSLNRLETQISTTDARTSHQVSADRSAGGAREVAAGRAASVAQPRRSRRDARVPGLPASRISRATRPSGSIRSAAAAS